MGAPSWTVDSLLENIRARGQLATNSQNLTEADLLEFIDQEVQTFICPQLIASTEEYLVAQHDTPIQAGQQAYDIPPRAMGRELRDVQIMGNVGGGNQFIQLPRLEPETSPDLINGWSQVFGYYFQGDQLILASTPAVQGTLRQKYFLRPNAAVLSSACAVVSSVDVTRTVVTTQATLPSTMVPGVELDFVAHRPGFRTLKMDSLATTTTSGTTLTVTEPLPSSVVPGTYVCLAQEAPVVQIPPEWYAVLAERVTFRCLEAMGDPKAAVQKTLADEMLKGVLSLIQPRSKGNARPIISRYGPGTYTGFGSWAWRYRRW